MKLVLQRVSEASVTIDGEVKAAIDRGYVILLGITHEDNETDIDWLTSKIKGLRVFTDDKGAMNLSLAEVDGQVLVISQFTLYASTKKGNRPSFLEAARPDQANTLYELFVDTLSRKLDKNIATGSFGADMKVKLVNDGPVTLIIDSKKRV